MVKRDYYIILGVSRSESAAGIHEAFRRLAKEYHPDRGGPDTTATFQEIAHAYEILSDPARRRKYDETLSVPEQSIRSEPAEPKAPHRRYPAEPLIPKPISGFPGFQTIRPSLDVLLNRFFREFSVTKPTEAEPLQGFDIDVVLTPFEAAQGVVVPIELPFSQTCSWCGGSGTEWLSPCRACHGQGSIEEYGKISVRIPAGILHRSVIELPVHGPGIHNLYLRLHIRVSGYSR